MSASAHEELLCVTCRASMYSVCYVRLDGKGVQKKIRTEILFV